MSTKKSDLEKALNKVIDAWEELDGGNHSQLVVQSWLVGQMSPAINKARRVLGRKKPKE